MKKLIYCAAVLVTALFAGSCQRELLDPAQGDTVIYTVNIPDAAATKTIGDGTNVNKVVYAVYRVTGETEDVAKITLLEEELMYQKVVDVNTTTGTAEVPLEVMKNQDYLVLFWAQVGNAWFDADSYHFGTAGIRYPEDYTPNDDKYAAFSGVEYISVNGASKRNITLTRPFGQLNIATKLPNPDLFTPVITGTKVTVDGAATYYDVATGKGIEGKLEFNATGTISEGFPNYDEYLSMNYVFVPDQKATVTVEYVIETQSHGTVRNEISYVPIQKNYKTNIIGSLLTSKVNYEVELKRDWTTPDKDVHVVEADNIQTVLDNAVAGTTIQLKKGVNYGTLYMRPVAGGAQTKVVDWIGNNYRFETYSLFENITIVGADGATVDAIKIEGGTYYNTEHSQAATYPVMLSLVELKNVVFDGVTFTGKGGYDPQGYGNAINLSGNNIKVDGLTIKNCVLNNSENNARLLYKTESTTHVHNYSYNGQNYTFSPSLKDITITDCTFNGGYMGLELRETENLTITNNTFNVADRNILIPVNSGCTYSGKVTITGNVSNNAKQRFVRMSGAGDAEVVITANTINNYQGADADYIKVTDGNNVTIQNNPISYGEIIYDIDLKNGEIVTLPAKEGDRTVLVKGQGTLVLNGTTITTTEGPAIEVAEGAKVTLRVINGNVNITGATNGIQVPNSAELTVTGEGSLNVVGNNGSGIGYASTSEKTNTAGKITISNLASLTAEGTGDHAYGIGSKASHVRIENSTINHACGGHIQPLFINDTKYGKSEPEGAPAIGGTKIEIVESTIKKADGGSKAAAIGAEFWQSTSIEIVKSTIEEANGGNASAGIGGSRYNGDDKYNVSIKIQNSTVTATGGQHGAGIGSGYDTNCNGQDYTAENKIEIDEESVINAKGGKYAAGIGTGFHSAYLTGSIAAGATINAESGEAFYKDSYTTAQNIGYGVVDPAREYSGENATIRFKVAGKVIGTPYGIPVAKVGDTQYKSIDEAIAAWSNNTTLTLLANVTLSDVIKISSTEMHTLDLGTYTLTGATGKNAIEIINNGRSKASYALDIKADATNPGGITASSAVVKTTGKSGVQDRPIISFYNGVFNANNIINHSGSSGTNSPQFTFYNGVYNGNISTNRAICIFEGGTFNGRFFMSVDSSSYARIGGGKFKYMDNLYGSALNADKFTIGSAKGVFDRGVYVDDEDYIVVGGPVITEFGDKFAARTTKISEVGSYLPYSSAAEYGVYYTNAQMAIDKHKEANVDLK